MREPYSPRSTIVTPATERRLLGTRRVALPRISAAERAIIHENGNHWVLDSGRHYAVMIAGITHSTSDSAYAHDADGLSIAIARCDYLAARKA